VPAQLQFARIWLGLRVRVLAGLIVARLLVAVRGSAFFGLCSGVALLLVRVSRRCRLAAAGEQKTGKGADGGYFAHHSLGWICAAAQHTSKNSSFRAAGQ
jgi:hypothetical protein